MWVDQHSPSETGNTTMSKADITVIVIGCIALLAGVRWAART
jgi:hypothetical protein